jgi:hypothetical protein
MKAMKRLTLAKKLKREAFNASHFIASVAQLWLCLLHLNQMILETFWPRRIFIPKPAKLYYQM